MQKLLAMFGIGMGIFFILAGVSVAFFTPKPVLDWLDVNSLPKYVGQLGGFVVLAYGLFRISRSIKVLRNKQQQ